MRNIEAVIFDMDGVIVDSENIWTQAEYEVFSALGVLVTPEHASKTASMTTGEVAQYWFDLHPWANKSLNDVAQLVVERVKLLVRENECGVGNIQSFISYLKSKNLLIGLATNSPYSIVPVVLKKLGVYEMFDVISSADFVERGKPDPEIYLYTARKLHVPPYKCLAIEDSYSGMLAARDAGMKVAAFSNNCKNEPAAFADIVIHNFSEGKLIVDQLFSWR